MLTISKDVYNTGKNTYYLMPLEYKFYVTYAALENIDELDFRFIRSMGHVGTKIDYL
jgi:hypothetical protein